MLTLSELFLNLLRYLYENRIITILYINQPLLNYFEAFLLYISLHLFIFVIYDTKVTDDWDRRLIKSLLNSFLNEEMIYGNYNFFDVK